MTNIIIQPVIALMLLTCLVWCYMYFLRLKYIITHKIHAQKLATPEQCHSVLPSPINKPSNNLKNLFELPVVFYSLCFILILTEQTDITFVYLAWSFVVGRYFHSLFHCFFDSVIARFYAYFISSLVLWGMIIKLVYQVIVQ